MPKTEAEPEQVADRKRVKGIEPSYSAWEADVLPLNYTRRSNCWQVSGLKSLVHENVPVNAR